MKAKLERRLEALERARAPVKYVLLWADEEGGEESSGDRIQLRWADDLL
jgi:hypothetical protein